MAAGHQSALKIELKAITSVISNKTRVVPLLVSENASNTTKNAGIVICKYVSLCDDPIPCDSLGTQLLSS